MSSVQSKRAIGDFGEQAVCNYLKQQGAEILCRNYTIRGGEIDIIARLDTWILFVEVKTRRANAAVSGMEAVDARKQKRIWQAAERYLLEHPIELQPRFDVAEVVYQGQTVLDVHYVVDAFDGSTPTQYDAAFS